MCDLCLTFPCSPGCPNEAEGKKIETCTECREPIYEGDEFCYIEECAYCAGCLENMSTRRLLMLCGVEMLTAEDV